MGEGKFHAVPGDKDMFRMQARRRGPVGHPPHGFHIIVIVARNGIQRKVLRQFNQAPETLRRGAVAQEDEMSATQQAHPVHGWLQMVCAVVQVGKNAYLHLFSAIHGMNGPCL